MYKIHSIRTIGSMVFLALTKSGKISLETKLELWSNSTNITSSCDILLIYVVLLNNIKYYFFE